MAGAEIGNLDLIEDKIFKLCEKIGVTVEEILQNISSDTCWTMQ